VMMRFMAEDGSMVFRYDMRWLVDDGGGIIEGGMMLIDFSTRFARSK
jgi:hypothetical protein